MSNFNIEVNDDESLYVGEGTYSSANIEARPFNKTTYIIKIVDGWEIHMSKEPPHWFYRKMMSLVFGWEFEIL